MLNFTSLRFPKLQIFVEMFYVDLDTNMAAEHGGLTLATKLTRRLIIGTVRNIYSSLFPNT